MNPVVFDIINRRRRDAGFAAALAVTPSDNDRVLARTVFEAVARDRDRLEEELHALEAGLRATGADAISIERARAVYAANQFPDTHEPDAFADDEIDAVLRVRAWVPPARK